MGGSPHCRQSGRYVTARIPAPQMKEWTGICRGQNKGDQILGIALRGGGVEACLDGQSRRSITDTPSGKRQGLSCLAQTKGGLDSGFRGQDDGRPIEGREVGREEGRLHQRGGNGVEDARHVRRKLCGKAVALGGWAGDKQRNGAGLRDHAKGVTPKPYPPAMDMALLTFLGIESSCDDSAAAVVRLQDGGVPEILSSVVEGQARLHAAFGGVVPEIAARAHAERLDHCVDRALAESGIALGDVDGIAVTSGPGLIGGVLSGVMLAKGLAAGSGIPLWGVNHLAGHALTPRLTDGLDFPYLMLLVSGGHCQYLIVESVDRFRRLGGTIDDAPGEAFDKTAKLLGLPQPGGPSVEAEAALGDARRFVFPRPLLDRPGCDLSFSGLKTALLRARDALVLEKGGISLQDRRDLCAGFQAAVADVLAEKTRRALVQMADVGGRPTLAVAGGVAANRAIRAMLETVSTDMGAAFVAPPLRLCTDNAAMIAWAGIEQARSGGLAGTDLIARPRWPLDSNAAPMIGSGKKGAKA